MDSEDIPARDWLDHTPDKDDAPFVMTRRGFLGSAAGATAALTANLASAATPVADEVDLDFLNARDEAGTEYLKIQIIHGVGPVEEKAWQDAIAKAQELPTKATPEQKQASRDDVRKIRDDLRELKDSLSTSGPSWNLYPRMFGPKARFVLKSTRDRDNPALKIYTLRVQNAAFGATSGVSLSLTFTQVAIAGADYVPRKTAPLEFHISLETDAWTRVKDKFTGQVSPEVDASLTETLTLRYFLSEYGEAPHDLTHDLPIKQVSPALADMLNGLITCPQQRPRGNLRISFSKDAVWTLSQLGEDAPCMGALGNRIHLSQLHLFWQRSDPTASGTPPTDAPFTGRGSVMETTTFDITTSDGPGLSLRPQAALPDLHLRVIPTPNSKTPQLRAEALWSGDWTALQLTGSNTQRAGPFPTLRGSLLERVDAPRNSRKAGAAERLGSLSFQAEYPAPGPSSGSGPGSGKAEKAGRYIRLSTPIGSFTAAGLHTEKEAQDDNQQVRFPVRRGQPVLILYDWGSSDGGSRAEPIARWIEASVQITDSDIALDDAEYSRLSFAPSELQLIYTADKAGLPNRPQRNHVLLGQNLSGEIARLDLGRASLRASRSSDLLSLVFRFSDLALSFSEAGREIVRTDEACLIRTRTESGGREVPHDRRPVLVVDFPGQHLFEEARAVPSLPPMPDVTLQHSVTFNRETNAVALGTSFKGQTPPVMSEANGVVTFNPDNRVHVVELLRDMPDVDQRLAFRKGLSALKSTPIKEGAENEQGGVETKGENCNDPNFTAFGEFACKYQKNARKLLRRARLPKDQMIYIGPYALDVDAMRVARRVHEMEAMATLKIHVNAMFAALADKTPAPIDPTGNLEGARAQEIKLESAFPAYQQFRQYYRDLLTSSVFDPKVSQKLGGFKANSTGPADVEFFIFYHGAKTPPYDKVRELYLDALGGRESTDGPVRARLARPSRLAFRVTCRDGVNVARARVDGLFQNEDEESRLLRDTFDFSLTTLTNFHGLELAVTQRAEMLYDPGNLGQIDGARPRVLDLRSGAMLDRLGFSEGRYVTVAQRLSEVASSLTPPSQFETAIEIPARLTLSPHQNAVVLTPGEAQAGIFDLDPSDGCAPGTATQGPQRVWSADFMTSAAGGQLDPGIRAVHSPDLRPDFVWHKWHDLGRLPLENNRGHRIPGGNAPPRGPWAPWYLGRHNTQRGEDPAKAILNSLAADEDEPTQKALLQTDCAGVNGTADKERVFPGMILSLCGTEKLRGNGANLDLTFRGPTDAFARHEIVVLSSAWGLPVAGRRNANGQLSKAASQLDPEKRHRLGDLAPGSALYRPKALNVAELSLTSLGGTLRHETGFQPPLAARWMNKAPLFDAMVVERWQQWTNLGRDVYCEVVYKGFLFPLGIRASLVQVTERSFFIESGSGRITATLRQRMFIRVAETDRAYPAVKQPNEGRRFPVRNLKLLTTTTPDIVDPNDPPVRSGEKVTALGNGRVDFPNGTGLVFWPRTARLQEANVRFEMEIDSTRTDMPLLFVDNTAADDADLLKEITDYYNARPSPDHPLKDPAAAFQPLNHLRTMSLSGAKLRYAPERKAGTASYETDHWTLRATGAFVPQGTVRAAGDGDAIEAHAPNHTNYDAGPFQIAADQPAFYPALDIARLRLSQTERLIGRSLPTVRAHFDARYLEHGFATDKGEAAGQDQAGGQKTGHLSASPLGHENVNEIFMVLSDQPAQTMRDKGDQSGGVFRPEGFVVALSRVKGAMTRKSTVTLSPIKDDGDDKDTVYSMSELFNAPPAPPKQATATANVAAAPASADPAALDKIRDVYKNFFSDDAKILGLVKVRDLIELIQALASPQDGLPELQEEITFGAGAADAGAEAIREKVVRPMAAAAREVRDGWNQLEEVINTAQEGTAALTGVRIRIAEVFPELDQSLDELADALSRAEIETDTVLFALELGACHAAGQRFLNAVERSAANPLERINDAVLGNFKAALDLFDKLQRERERVLIELLQGQLDLWLPPASELKTQIRPWAKSISLALMPGKDKADLTHVGWQRAEIVPLPGKGALKTEDDRKVLTELFGFAANDLRAILQAYCEFALCRFVDKPLDLPNADELTKRFLEKRKPPSTANDIDKLGWIDFGNKIPTDDLQAAVDEGLEKLSTILTWRLPDGPEKERAQRLIDETDEALKQVIDTGSKTLGARNNAELIRNRYVLCVLLAVADNLPNRPRLPDLPDLDTETVRKLLAQLLRILRDLLQAGADLIEWLVGLLADLVEEIAKILRALAKLLSAIRPPDPIKGLDLGKLLEALRDLLPDLSPPPLEFNLDFCQDVFDPVWQPTRATLGALSTLANDIAICATDSKLPPVSDAGNIWPAAGLSDAEWKKEEEHLCGILFRAQALVTDLMAPVAEKGQLTDQLDDVHTAVGKIKLPDDIPEAQKKAAVEALQALSGAIDDTHALLGDLRTALQGAYIAGVEDGAALSTLKKSFAAAGALDPCAVEDADDIEPTIKGILALKNLPRDLKRFTRAREDFLNKMIAAQKAIVDAVNAIANEDRKLALPLAVGVLTLLAKAGMPITQEAPDKPIQLPTWMSDAEDAFGKLLDTLNDTQNKVQNVVARVAQTLCQGIDEALGLAKELETLQTTLAGHAQTVAPYVDLTELDKILKGDDLAKLQTKLSGVRAELAGIKAKIGQPDAKPYSFRDIANLSVDGVTLEQVFNPTPTDDKQNALLAQMAGLQAKATALVTPVAKQLRPYLDMDAKSAALKFLDDQEVVQTVLSSGFDYNGRKQTLPVLYASLSDLRNKSHAGLTDSAVIAEFAAQNLLALSDPFRPAITDIYTPGETVTALKIDNDQLAGDVAWLQRAAAADKKAPVLSDPQTRAFLQEFLREWATGAPTPILILRQIEELVRDVFQGELRSLIDFNHLRERFEDYLLSLVPGRIRMGYDFDLPLGSEVAAATAGIFAPGPGSTLKIAMQMEIDLNPGSLVEGKFEPSVQASSIGELGPFDIALVGDFFDALTLRFSGARFEAGTGRKPSFDIAYEDYIIGPELEFLQDLQSFLSPKDGSGAFVTFNPFLPGVEAGYRLSLGDFSVGNLAISNVALETSAILPFSNDEALFKASLSSRMSPFTLTYAPYGGSGFFAIYANPGGIIGLEASFEFGGSAVFAYGPLSGKGRLMAGVYVRQIKAGNTRVSEISMTFFVGGSASIWIFSMGCALSVKLGSINGNMTGQATFTYSFSIGIKDFDFSVTVQKQESKGFGGQSAMSGRRTRRFASLGSMGGDGGNLPDVSVKTDTKCQGEDWAAYQTYFEDEPLPEDFF